MFKKQMERLRFHIKHVFTQTRYKLNIYTEKEKEIFFGATDNAGVANVTDEEARAFFESIDNAMKKTIEFEPKRTVLYRGRHGHRCNFLTVRKYQKEILIKTIVLLMSGIDTIFVDYISPFGLAALEKLIEMREKGYPFKLYAIQGGLITKRKTYRLIPEIGSEIIILAGRCDKHLLPYSDGNMIKKVYRDVFRILDEDGISINPLVILEDLDDEEKNIEVQRSDMEE